MAKKGLSSFVIALVFVKKEFLVKVIWVTLNYIFNSKKIVSVAMLLYSTCRESTRLFIFMHPRPPGRHIGIDS